MERREREQLKSTETLRLGNEQKGFVLTTTKEGESKGIKMKTLLGNSPNNLTDLIPILHIREARLKGKDLSKITLFRKQVWKTGWGI